MADIFKEVDEDLRRDNAAKVGKKYAPLIIGVAAAVILTVAGVQGWREKPLLRLGISTKTGQGGRLGAFSGWNRRFWGVRGGFWVACGRGRFDVEFSPNPCIAGGGCGTFGGWVRRDMS